MTAINDLDTHKNSVGVNNHPDYDDMMQTTSGDNGTVVNFGRGYWDQMIDTFAGERAVKSRTTDYLPKTTGMLEQERQNSTIGRQIYLNYLYRACYTECLAKVVNAMMGLIFAAPIKVELPGVLAEMAEYGATIDGMSLETMAREVVGKQLTTGRIGLLLDPQDGKGKVCPKIALYNEKSILNWGEDRNKNLIWVWLDESGNVANNQTGQYEWKNRYRVVVLEQKEYGEYGEMYEYTTDDLASVNMGVVPEYAFYPQIAGQTINRIPLQIINSTDLSNGCSIPLMMPVSNLALSIYRNSADYELSLFQTAQPTVVTSGVQAGDNIMLGANGHLNFTAADAKAYFLEVAGSGIDKLRQAMMDKTGLVNDFSVEMAENGAESGVALTVRLTIKTANLTNVVATCEEGIRRTLRMAAEWCGENPDDVVFEMNKEFRDDQASVDDLVKLSSLVSIGRFTKRDLHRAQLEAGWTTEEDFAEWSNQLEDSAEMMPTVGAVQEANNNNEENQGDESGAEE